MADLRTRYMGLELKNPVIIGANNLVTDTDNLKKMEDAGAAGVVYKSIFEEQIQLENLELYEGKSEYDDRNAEMITLFPDIGKDNSDIAGHMTALRKAKKAVSIPLFASINAINLDTWKEYSKRIEDTGVDGIELNLYAVPENKGNGSVDIEKRQIEYIKAVRSVVHIPVSVKLSPYYSDPLNHIYEIDKAGVDGLVLFNRLFQPDIDIYTEEHYFPYSLSNREDNRLPIRFAGLLYGNTKSSVCTNSGIMNGTDVVKMILAGADSVQIVSTLYLHQIEVISSIVRELEQWMNNKGYNNIESFRGKLSWQNSNNKMPYRRAQYMDYMKTTMEILKQYKAIP
jgi:dihydroorotate dehydrogenase (fumarate)